MAQGTPLPDNVEKYYDTIDKYKEDFKTQPPTTAITTAHDIRKFEITLYWQRALYFWTITTIVFGAYGLIRNSKELGASKDVYLFLICSFGLLISFAWYFVNRGSKYWQTHWERIVDALEDDITGPLYKTVVNPCFGGKRSDFGIVYGSGRYSVSKINQVISLLVVVVWCCLWLWKLLFTFYPAIALQTISFRIHTNITLDIYQAMVALITIFTVIGWILLRRATFVKYSFKGHENGYFLKRKP